MISDAASLADLEAFGAEICLIGAGPVGIATALELVARGRRVLLLESGGRSAQPEVQELSRGENLSPGWHHEPVITVARRLGGTSNLWGGRCLPFDPVDFAQRPWLDLPAWPVADADLAPFLARACALMGAGEAVWREDLPGVAAAGPIDPAFDFEALERWSNVPRIQELHREALEGHETLLVALGATVTGLEQAADGRLSGLRLHLEGREGGVLPVREAVLTAGGNESTRLLLAHQRRRPDLFGGPEGPLGRHYMGHVNGQIADVTFANRALHDGLDFHADAHGSYVRRRLVPRAEVQREARLTNVAFWPVVPPIADPAHRSGPLSAAFLVLSVGPLGRRLVAEAIRRPNVGEPPYRRLAHLGNILRDPVRTLWVVPDYLWRSRVAKLRLPGFFVTNRARRYGLEYHAEHLPHADSRITLSEEVDRTGLPRIRVDLRFKTADAEAVVRAHDRLERWLGETGLGRLDYRMPRKDRAQAVLDAALHGNHQVGTIRMGEDPARAVVDAACRCFGIPNLSVVSTAVLPTSGQANPTLTAVQLGLRCAARLSP
jgi:choline dehydrogenase-like flavoprotein